MIQTQTQTMSQTLADIETAHGQTRQTEDGRPITAEGNIHTFAPTGASSSSSWTPQLPNPNPQPFGAPQTFGPSIRQRAMTENAHRPPTNVLYPQTGSASSNPQTYSIATPPEPINPETPHNPTLGTDPLFARDPWAGASQGKGKGKGKRERERERREREHSSLGEMGG